jgi:hypothetical protein
LIPESEGDLKASTEGIDDIAKVESAVVTEDLTKNGEKRTAIRSPRNSFGFVFQGGPFLCIG